MSSVRNLVLAAAIVAATPAYADEIRIVSWGGLATEANRAGYWDPYTAATGVTVLDDVYSGELAKIRAQIETGSYQWDIAEVEDAEASAGCQEGLYERLDESLFDMEDMLPGSILDCAALQGAVAIGLAYHKDAYPEAPRTWADFFDLEKFPGKRGMRKSASYTLEIALLADGVPVDQVYDVLSTKEGQDRAFATLDRLKGSIVWWSASSELVQGFVAREFLMSAAYNARVAHANQVEKQDLGFVWEAGYISGNNYWAILKGAPNAEEAKKFISWATKPEPGAEYMRHIAYGVGNKKAFDLLEPEYLIFMAGVPERLPYAVQPNPEFWTTHYDSLTERLNAWIAASE